MGPADMMGLASVMLDFTATTVQVNSQKPFVVETGQGLYYDRCQGQTPAWHLQNLRISLLAPTDFEVLCSNWHLRALFYWTDGTLSFKFLTQALLVFAVVALQGVLILPSQTWSSEARNLLYWILVGHIWVVIVLHLIFLSWNSSSSFYFICKQLSFSQFSPDIKFPCIYKVFVIIFCTLHQRQHCSDWGKPW